jgi:subtilisin family serine protease
MRQLIVGMACAVAALGLSAASGARSDRSAKQPAYADGAVIVDYGVGTDARLRTGLERGVGGTVRHRFRNGAVLLSVPSGQVSSAIDALRRSGQVRYAEPDYLQVASAVPNDPSFTKQWALSNLGQSVNGTTGTAGDDERATPAWDVTTGSSSIVVAEVDTGVDYNHPDLAANIWSNPGGINGCAAGTHGYNVLTSTCDPMDDDTSYGGHGTHVAGIIGAVGNNGVGVSGVNWTTRILPVKWLNSSGSGTTSQLISALDWVLQAKQAGVNIRVVNDSATFVGTSFSQALSDEIDALGQAGILFVTAAGNTGEDNDDPSVGRYPCRYDRPTEICVTASAQNDTLPSWANYGATTVDLAAPGNNIYSTLRNNTYGFINGGSMAAAQVSGAAGLILSADSLSTTALKADILDNVDPVAALSGLVRTGGRLDICSAIPGCVSRPTPSSLPVVSGAPQQGQTVAVSNGSWHGSPTSYTYQWERCDASGANCTSISGATQSSYLVTAADVGATLRGAVTATNAYGTGAAESAQTAVVTAGASNGTFGVTTVGGSSDPLTIDRKRVNHFSLGVSGNVTKLSMYLEPGGKAGTEVFKGVIYSDSGGKPSALLGVTSQVTFQSGSAAGWYDLPFSSPVSLPAGTYWVGAISGGTARVAALRFTRSTNSRAYNSNSYGSGPTNPFGSATIDSELMSIYASYTTGAAPSPPVNAVLPAVSGQAGQGQTLTVSNGTWSNSPTSYAYQWLRCDTGGASCTSIATATSASYVVASADVGSTLRATVTATNAGGSASATSNQTAVVTAGTTSGTFGTTTVGANPDPILADRKRVNRYTLGTAAHVSKLSIYLQPAGTSGTQLFEGLIYADTGGAPGALVAVSTPFTFSSSNPAGWYDLVFSSPVALSAGNYWIGIISGNTSHVAAFRWTSVGGSRDYNADSYTSGPSNPFGTPTIDSEEMSVYASYTTP